MGTDLDQLVSNLPPQVGGQYEQIPLNNQNLFPWGDLKAAGSLGRIPVYPDDMPPVLALPYAYGPQFPRVNRCEDNGSLHVFVTNQSGGGGSSPLVLQEDGERGILINNNEQIITQDSSTNIILHGWAWSFYADDNTGGVYNYCYVVIQGGNKFSSHGLVLGSVGQGGAGGSGMVTAQPTWGWGWSERGIDIAQSFNDTGYTFKVRSSALQIRCDAWIMFEVKP